VPSCCASESDKMTDVVLQSIPVLAVDQVSDENSTKPVISKTATLQVDAYSAQKLALAQQLGTLTLALRNVADTTAGPRNTVIGRDITASRLYIGERGTGAAAPRAPAMAYRAPPRRPAATGAPIPTYTSPTMTVVRGTKTSEESVYHGY
jgi:pilus assembly protein CpaB